MSRRNAVTLERHHRQHGGEAGGTDRHRAARAIARGQSHQPIALDPRLFRIAAEMGFAQSPTIKNDSVTRPPLRMRGGFHRAGEIDAGNHRKTANDRRFAGEREPVLVIHRRPFDADGDITVH